MCVPRRRLDKQRQRLGNSRRLPRRCLPLLRCNSCPGCRAVPSLCRPLTSRTPRWIVVSTSYFRTDAEAADRPCRARLAGVVTRQGELRGQDDRKRVDEVLAAARQTRGHIECTCRARPGCPRTRRRVRRLLGPLGSLAALHRSAAPAARLAPLHVGRLKYAPALVVAVTTEDELGQRQQFLQFRESASVSIGIPTPPIAGR